jgi:3'(2'), 5'-bisphosphate nucleotidase
MNAELSDRLTALVSRAGQAILDIARPALNVRVKADASPLTAADEASNTILLAGLAELLPGVPVVSEESPQRADPRALAGLFVLIDPLDGTKEFISGTAEFTVNLALVEGGRPVAGIIGVPALGLVFRGVTGGGAQRLRLAAGREPAAATEIAAITTRARPATGIVAAVSRSHLDERTKLFVERLKVAERLSCGSALKFCRLAEGRVDVYPRLSPTCEWDIAAGHALVTAAGGIVTAPDGRALSFGHAEARFRVPGFIAWGDPHDIETVAG